jgi:hypothetical protein
VGRRGDVEVTAEHTFTIAVHNQARLGVAFLDRNVTGPAALSYTLAEKMLEPCAILENLWHMNDVRMGEGASRVVTAADREAIRVATATDREAIRALVNQAFEVERFLTKGGGDRLQGDGEFEALWERGTFLVKEEDGALAGCVYVEPRSERIFASSQCSGDSRSVAFLKGKATSSPTLLYAPEAKTH